MTSFSLRMVSKAYGGIKVDAFNYPPMIWTRIG